MRWKRIVLLIWLGTWPLWCWTSTTAKGGQMAEQLTEANEFTATVVVPEAGDDRTAASVRGAFQSLANRSRYLLQLIGDLLSEDNIWTGWNRFRGGFTMTQGLGLAGPTNEALYTDEAGLPVPRRRTVMIDPAAIQGAAWQPRVQGTAGATGTNLSGGWGKLLLPIPSGGQLKRVRIGYEHKVAGDSADIYIRRTTYAKTTPFTQYPAFKLIDKPTSGTIGQEVWDSDEITDPALDASTTSYTLEISASDDTTQPLPDIVHWIELQYLDPGPRNF